MATAVSLWSPVIITARTCASAQRAHRLLHARARRVDHPDEAEEREPLLELRARAILARAARAALGGSERRGIARSRRATASTRSAWPLIRSASAEDRRARSRRRAARGPCVVSQLDAEREQDVGAALRVRRPRARARRASRSVMRLRSLSNGSSSHDLVRRRDRLARAARPWPRA